MRKMRETGLDAIGRAFPHMVAGQVGYRHQHSLQLISTSMSSKIDSHPRGGCGIFMSHTGNQMRRFTVVRNTCVTRLIAPRVTRFVMARVALRIGESSSGHQQCSASISSARK
jgi:hypothetical protein